MRFVVILSKVAIYFILYAILAAIAAANHKPAFASINKIMKAIIDIQKMQDLLLAFYKTMTVWSITFIGTTFVAVLVGIGLGRFKVLSRWLAGDLDYWRSLPATVLALFAFAAFGDNMFTRALPAIYVTFFLIVYYTNKASVVVDKVRIEHLKDLGASNIFITLNCYIPEIMGNLIISIRQAISLSFLVLVSTELILGSHGGNGIGRYLIDELNALRYPTVIICLFCLGIIGYLLNRVGYFLHINITPWETPER